MLQVSPMTRQPFLTFLTVVKVRFLTRCQQWVVLTNEARLIISRLHLTGTPACHAKHKPSAADREFDNRLQTRLF